MTKEETVKILGRDPQIGDVFCQMPGLPPLELYMVCETWLPYNTYFPTLPMSGLDWNANELGLTSTLHLANHKNHARFVWNMQEAGEACTQEYLAMWRANKSAQHIEQMVAQIQGMEQIRANVRNKVNERNQIKWQQHMKAYGGNL